VIAEKAQLKHINKQADVVSVPTKPKKKTQQERGVVTIFVCGSQVLTKLFLSFGSQTLLHTPQYCFDLYNCQTQLKQQTNHRQKTCGDGYIQWIPSNAFPGYIAVAVIVVMN
jgi:hypothetical protein